MNTRLLRKLMRFQNRYHVLTAIFIVWFFFFRMGNSNSYLRTAMMTNFIAVFCNVAFALLQAKRIQDLIPIRPFVILRIGQRDVWQTLAVDLMMRRFAYMVFVYGVAFLQTPIVEPGTAHAILFYLALWCIVAVITDFLLLQTWEFERGSRMLGGLTAVAVLISVLIQTAVVHNTPIADFIWVKVLGL